MITAKTKEVVGLPRAKAIGSREEEQYEYETGASRRVRRTQLVRYCSRHHHKEILNAKGDQVVP